MIWRLAWRNLGRNRRRTALTAAAAAFAVFLVILSLALARGSHDRWIEQAVRLYPGHVQVSLLGQREYGTLDYGMQLGAEARRALEALPGAEGWAPRLETWGLVIPDTEDALGRAAWIVGVDFERESGLTRLLESVDAGQLAPRAGFHPAVVGDALARALGVGVGDVIILMSADQYGSQAADRFRVTGMFEVGDARFDDYGVFTDVTTLQEFLEMGAAVSHLAVFAAEEWGAAQLAERLEAVFPSADYEVVPWPELIPDVVQFMLLDDVGNWLTLAILIVVVGFGLLNTVLMSVLERTHEFGVLRALGLRPRAVFALVMAESTLLSLLGTGIGLGMAVPLSLYLEQHPIPLWGEQLASAAEIFRIDPVLVFELTGLQLAGTVASLLVVSLLAALPPATRASRGRPVDALREAA